MVPFDPPLIYGKDGVLHFPWFSFWRSNPLAGERLSLFVTIVEDVLLQDPDLENARFQILDFSAPGPKLNRELKIIDAREIGRLTAKRKIEMLSVFAEGFVLATEALAQAAKERQEAQRQKDSDIGEQPGLFDSDR